MNTSRAIRLEAGGSTAAAIGLHEVIEVVTEGDLETVPRAPQYCRELLQWRDKWIPVFDLARWREGRAGSAGQFLVVVGYVPDSDGFLRHGCLRVPEFPKIIEVTDDRACRLPDDAEWGRIAHSCFREDDRQVPILLLCKVFEPGATGTSAVAGIPMSG